MRSLTVLMYIVFDDFIAIPNKIVMGGNSINFDLNSMVNSQYGIILPLYQIFPDGGFINDDFFKDENYNYMFGRLFFTISGNGYINVIYLGNDKKIEIWPYPKFINRVTLTENKADENIFNHILMRCNTIEECINKFDDINGMPSSNYTIYKREELHQLAAGKITVNDVSKTPVENKNRLIWLE